ncbi:MAG: FAD/NAD(P)-binding protein [Thermodesulfobacteriota bacterium]
MESGARHSRDHYLPRPALVLQSRPMTESDRFFEVRLECKEDLGHMPGQFVMVSIPGVGEAPISVSSSPTKKGSFEMIVRRMGNVTQAMHRLQPGDGIGVRGPFGAWFPVDGELKGRDIFFACGGLGLVPLRSAVNYVLDNRGDYGALQLYYGTKCPSDRLCVEELDRWRDRGDVSCEETVDKADENWSGNVGVITSLMTGLRVEPDRSAALLCGPPVMFKFVVGALRRAGMKDDHIWLSLERHMKCGVGKCGHCQMSNLYVCQDGAVFRFSDVEDIPEALQ